MGVLPFQVSSELQEKLVEFRDGLCNWVDMKLVTEDVPVETIHLVEHRKLEDFNSLQQYVSKDEARLVCLLCTIGIRPMEAAYVCAGSSLCGFRIRCCWIRAVCSCSRAQRLCPSELR